MTPSRIESPSSGFKAAFASLRSWFVGIGLFSGVINLLGLTGAIFMLQIYDRVLTSRSMPTLAALTAVAAGLYATQGVLDIIRSRLLVRMGSRVDEILGGRIYRSILQLPLRTALVGDGLQPVRDLDALRTFLTSHGPVAILDLPWMPIYLAFVFMLHPWLGWLASAGAIVLLALTILAEALSRAPTKKAMAEATRRQTLSAAGRRNAEVVRAMGFADRLTTRWQAINARYLAAQQKASDVAGGLGAVSKAFRTLLQSAMLALGAYLTIKGEVSAGAIIAASITSSRALAPIELAIANWKPFLAARQSRHRLRELLTALPVDPAPLSLPAPARQLAVETLSVRAPGTATPIVQNVSFVLTAGQALGIIGPSAAGKSTLVRAIVGAWPVLRGSVRIDGASLDQWNPAELGRHVGYLPQDIELFDGTVAENIARLDDNLEPEAIVAAARAANVHEMILRLPEGYATRIGENGMALSAGQRQRLGLARALYGDPFLVVLDEPNSNLDADGEIALTRAIRRARDQGRIVLIVAHRPSAIAAVDLLAVLVDGTLQAFGPKEDVLRKTVQQAGAALRPSGLPVAAEAT